MRARDMRFFHQRSDLLSRALGCFANDFLLEGFGNGLLLDIILIPTLAHPAILLAPTRLLGSDWRTFLVGDFARDYFDG